jgi:hypothetical protein
MSCTWERRSTDTSGACLLLLLSLLALLPACRTPKTRPYVTPEVRFNNGSVETGAPVEVTYTFRTDSEFPGLKKNLVVFVHFRDPGGVIQFVDDHIPPVRTNQWKASGEYAYTRTVFVPENIPLGKYDVELGMYTPVGKGERFVLNAPMRSERTYYVASLVVGAPSTEEAAEYVSGWYDVEREPNNPWYHWRWTADRAVKRMPTPRADSILYLRADTDRPSFATPPTVTLLVGGRTIDSFAVDTAEIFLKRYRLPAADLGTSPGVNLEIRISRTFRPSDTTPNGDTRRLGLRVYSLYLCRAE